MERFLDDARRCTTRLGEPKTLTLVRQRFEARELVETADPTALEEVERLHQLRLADARNASTIASALARRSRSLPVIARALGVWASALRVSGQTDRAMMVIAAAFELAERRLPILAELCQRSSYLAADRGDLRLAADLAARALVNHALCGSTLGIGRSLVDCGIALLHNDETPDAESAFRAALTFLPESEEFHCRCASLHGLCLIAVREGRGTEARDYASRAIENAGSLPRSEAALIRWVLARLAHADNDGDFAISHYQAAAEGLRRSIDSALASAEIAHVHLDLGLPFNALAFATNVTPLILQIDNPMAEAAFANLLIAARQGELSIEVTRRVLCELEAAGAGQGMPRPQRLTA